MSPKTLNWHEAQDALHSHLYGQGIQTLAGEQRTWWATPEQVAGLGSMLAPLAAAYGQVTITVRDDGDFRVALAIRPRPDVMNPQEIASFAESLSGPQVQRLGDLYAKPWGRVRARRRGRSR